MLHVKGGFTRILTFHRLADRVASHRRSSGVQMTMKGFRRPLLPWPSLQRRGAFTDLWRLQPT